MIRDANEVEQKFPQTNVAVSPQGVKITIIQAPGFETSFTLSEETMNQIEQLRRQSRQEIKNSLALIKHVNSSKVN